MKKYYYDMHVHNGVSSACASITPEEVVDLYLRHGFTGIVVTDHFLRGNAKVDRTQDWKEQIRQYFDGYHQVKAVGDQKGLQVFNGVEISNEGADIVCYGLPESFYEAHPEIMELPFSAVIALATENGAFVTQAHPFRRNSYINHVMLFGQYTDAIEVFNANRRDVENKLAKDYADAYGLLYTAGSDLHHCRQVVLGGVAVNKKVDSLSELIDCIKKRESSVIKVKVKPDKK